MNPLHLEKKKPIFDDHIPLVELTRWFQNQYTKRTVYKWVKEGMPHKRIRGRLWFVKQDVSLWLERSSL